MTFDVAEMKSRMSCVELAQQMGLPIQKAGDRCRSPFHEGKNNSSMSVMDEYWYSFSDQMGGDQIDLLAQMQFRGDRGVAIREFAKMTGMDRDFDSEGWKRETKLLESFVEKSHKRFPLILQYLSTRRITQETAERLKLGYDSGRLVIPYLKGEKPYNWISRALANQEPKYLKKPNTDFTDPAPWGMHTIQRKGDTLYIAEGAFDAISIEQEGFPVLATMGGYFGSKTMSLVTGICKRFKNIILTFDNDNGGRTFTRDFSKVLIDSRIRFQVAIIPKPYKDISDYYTAGCAIQDLELVDGLGYMARGITDVEELKLFASRIARFCDPVDIATILDHAINFSAAQVKAVNRIISSAPSEKTIAEEIVKKTNLICVDQDGFYVWDRMNWKKVPDVTIKQMAHLAYGNYSTANRCNAVCTLLKSMVDRQVRFDRNPLLTFSNGTLELETGRFRDADPLDYCSIRLDYPYDPKAKCPQWVKFIDSVTAGRQNDKIMLQQIAGYVLFPDCRFQKIFALIGKGGNGKSVYLDILRKVFGDGNCSNIEPDKLTNEFYPIHLKNSLLNLGTEINADFSKAESLLKQISAGETIMGCFKGMTHIHFNPRCKLVYACNEMPRASVVKGLDRRMMFVDFPVKFVAEPDPENPLEQKIDIFIYPKLCEELSGVFNWVYAGYKDLMLRGKFIDTEDQERYIQQFKEISNPVMVFCDDHQFEGMMSRDEIYAMYGDWCENTGNRKLSREVFFPRFVEQMGKRIIYKGRRMVQKKRTMVIEFGEEFTDYEGETPFDQQ